jgi:hypothetical protein
MQEQTDNHTIIDYTSTILHRASPIDKRPHLKNIYGHMDHYAHSSQFYDQVHSYQHLDFSNNLRRPSPSRDSTAPIAGGGLSLTAMDAIIDQTMEELQRIDRMQKQRLVDHHSSQLEKLRRDDSRMKSFCTRQHSVHPSSIDPTAKVSLFN